MSIQASLLGTGMAVAGSAASIKKTLKQRQEEQLKKIKEQQEAKKKQRRNFMTYLRKQPTSLGGTVGELPEKMQKQIAASYSKSQRARMMDEMDREAKNKGDKK